MWTDSNGILRNTICKSNQSNVATVNNDFPCGSPEENILFFKDVTPPEAQNVKNSMSHWLEPIPQKSRVVMFLDKDHLDEYKQQPV